MWLTAAVFSAVFAALTAILAKCGIRKTDSDVATAIRTAVVLVFSWIMVFISGSAGSISQISAKSLIFLTLSGIATGASWICYFKALSLGDVNKVVPIDKSSTVLTVLLAIICFGETEHLAVKLIGTALLGVGTLLMVEKNRPKIPQAARATCSMPSARRYSPPRPLYSPRSASRALSQTLRPLSARRWCWSWRG